MQCRGSSSFIQPRSIPSAVSAPAVRTSADEVRPPPPVNLISSFSRPLFSSSPPNISLSVVQALAALSVGAADALHELSQAFLPRAGPLLPPSWPLASVSRRVKALETDFVVTAVMAAKFGKLCGELLKPPSQRQQQQAKPSPAAPSSSSTPSGPGSPEAPWPFLLLPPP